MPYSESRAASHFQLTVAMEEQNASKQHFQETSEIQISLVQLLDFFPCRSPNLNFKNSITEVQTKHICRTDVTADDIIFRLLFSNLYCLSLSLF